MASPENFGILLLNFLPANEALYVTDDGVNTDGDWERCFYYNNLNWPYDCGEGTFNAAPREKTWSYERSTATPAGTVLTRSDFSGQQGDDCCFDTAGDQLLAFVGLVSSPSFICALNNYKDHAWQNWYEDWSNIERKTWIPTGLEVDAENATAVAVVQHSGVGYTGPTSGSPLQLREWVNTYASLPPAP